MKNKINNKGYSLIELLVVVVIFSIITIIAVQALLTVLVSSHKADAVSRVRENLDFAMETMTRQLYNSRYITSPCTNTPASQLVFTDSNETQVTFSCVNPNTSNSVSSIASASGIIAPSPVPMTSADINITACSFTCVPGTSTTAPYITISASAKELTGAGTSGIAGEQNNAVVSVTTQVTLRTY